MEIIVKYIIDSNEGTLKGINIYGEAIRYSDFQLTESNLFYNKNSNAKNSTRFIHIADCELIKEEDDKTEHKTRKIILKVENHEILHIVNKIELDNNFTKTIDKN